MSGINQIQSVSSTCRETIYFKIEYFCDTSKHFLCIHLFVIQQNNSDDGLWTVFTGQDDINKVALIDKWNGEDHITWWANEWANMINGTGKKINYSPGGGTQIIFRRGVRPEV